MNKLPIGLLVFFCSHGVARADTSTVAEKLFQEGRRLFAEGQTKEACEKFQKSQDLDPSAGTLLNLAACREKNGQLASAWKAYTDARLAAAARNKPEWEESAEEHARSLEPRLPRILVTCSQSDIEILVDDVRLSPRELNVEIPVDPGTHRVDARRRDHVVYTTSLRIVEKELARVNVPIIDEGASSPALNAGDRADAAKSGGFATIQRPLGIGLIGVGAAAFGVGVVTGVLAMGKVSDAEEQCPALLNGDEPVPCNRNAISDNDSARTLGNVSTITLVAGGAFAAAGAAFLLFAPKKERASLTPFVSQSSVGTSLQMAF